MAKPETRKSRDNISALRDAFNSHREEDRIALEGISGKLKENADKQDSLAETLSRIEKKLDADPENDKYILRPLENSLRPIFDAYNGVSVFSKWTVKGLLFLSLILGIVWAILQIAASKIAVKLP